MPEKPFSLQSAIIFIIIGMIFEIIGISINAINTLEGTLGLITSHTIMAVSAFSTFKYLVDIEKGKINSQKGIFISLIANFFGLTVAINIGYSNPGILAAVIFDSIGLLFLIYPSSMWWLRLLQNEIDT